MNIQDLENKITTLKTSVDNLNGKIEWINESISKTKINKLEYEVIKLTTFKAIEFLNILQKAIREKTTEKFETLVTYAIQYVFNKQDKAILEFGKRGNLPELEFKIQLDKSDETINPINAEGGGLSDIYTLALRMVLLEITNNKEILILDECLKHLSTEHRNRAFEFLKNINQKLNRQILFITHAPEFIEQADYKIRIG